MFTNCSCIPDGRAEAGLCDDRCPYLIPWSISIFLSSIAGSMKIAPNFIAIIRYMYVDQDSMITFVLIFCGISYSYMPLNVSVFV